MEKQEPTLTINDPSKDFDGKPVTVTFETNRASDEAVVELFDAGGACFLFLRTRRTQRFCSRRKTPVYGNRILLRARRTSSMVPSEVRYPFLGRLGRTVFGYRNIGRYGNGFAALKGNGRLYAPHYHYGSRGAVIDPSALWPARRRELGRPQRAVG